jgi:predicted  nucleic acid-binding Zn-ribbon protein
MTDPLDDGIDDGQSYTTNGTIFDEENVLTKKMDEYRRRLANMELELGNKKKLVGNLESILKSKKSKMVTVSDLQTDYLDLNKRVQIERDNLKGMQEKNTEVQGKIDTYRKNMEGGHKSLLDKEDS